MKQLEQANLKLKAEVVESRAMLEDFKAFMEIELNHLGSIKTDNDERMMRSMEYEEDGYTNCHQGDAVHGHQVHSENDLIPSLKMHIYMVELKLKNSEYNNHILQMQLDRMQNELDSSRACRTSHATGNQHPTHLFMTSFRHYG
ncbi:unnamed protein product [Albugo candida]|uniref:Uncharacterized protein n=1 Tax=Albugo candida TaxID=65357 RepID=A0A024GAI4_9STRA|nr:unnamed protein product [Albugo candida]|eukprot:CCI43679.1 unnamed protein product [Albugo candida]